MNYELRELSFGELIGKSFTLFLDNFLPLLALSLMAKLPATLFGLLGIPVESIMTITSVTTDSMIPTVLNFVISIFLEGVTIVYISQRYLGYKATLGGAFREISLILGNLIGLSILTSVMIAGLLLFATLSNMPVLMFGIVVAVIVLSISLTFASHTLIIENQKVIDAVRRSWTLIEKKRLRVFLTIMVLALISVVLLFIPLSFLGFNLQAIRSGALLRQNPLLSLVNWGVTSLTAPIMSCAIILLYYNLRIQKEGFDVEHLAQRFSENGIE